MNNHPILLIDDDLLVRLSWKMAAKSSGKELISFSTADEFFPQQSNFERTTPIYIDVSLANGVSGVDIAEQLRGLGFTNLYLATGHSADDFRHLTFLQGVVGKDPPWIT